MKGVRKRITTHIPKGYSRGRKAARTKQRGVTLFTGRPGAKRAKRGRR